MRVTREQVENILQDEPEGGSVIDDICRDWLDMQAERGAEAVILTMPHPPTSLSPNGRPNRWEKAADTKQVRRDAMMVTRSVIWQDGIDSHPWPAAVMDICWLFAGTQPDSDNIVARLKAVRDGIADALLVADDKHISIGSVTFERVPRKEQGVVITLTRKDTP
jgi:Holliday junction resolvase RusA-like endonuclease